MLGVRTFIPSIMDQYKLEEIKAILVEAEFQHQMVLVEAYHEVGKIISETKGEVAQLVQECAVSIGRSERTLWYAVKLYQKFPDLGKLPEGKNLSMNKIVTKYLTTPKEIEEHQHNPITICASCKKRLDIDKK